MLHDIAQWIPRLQAGEKIGIESYHAYKDRLPQGIKRIAFVGMGGSGVAGRIIKTFLDKQSDIEAVVLEGLEVPAYLQTDTFFIVMSYSGNTWETVTVLKELVAKKLPVMILSRGGRCVEIAQQEGLMLVDIPQALTPRSALGGFLGILFALCDEWLKYPGKLLIKRVIQHIDTHFEQLKDPRAYDGLLTLLAKRDFFHIWGINGDSQACAYRAQTQFNENGKIQPVNSLFPEVCHNLIVGFTKPQTEPLVLLFATDYISSDLKKAVIATEELLQNKGVALYKIPVLGDTFDCQFFHMVLWADFASCYVGQMNGVDLNSVLFIDALKEKHKQKGITV